MKRLGGKQTLVLAALVLFLSGCDLYSSKGFPYGEYVDYGIDNHRVSLFRQDTSAGDTTDSYVWKKYYYATKWDDANIEWAYRGSLVVKEDNVVFNLTEYWDTTSKSWKKFVKPGTWEGTWSLETNYLTLSWTTGGEYVLFAM